MCISCTMWIRSVISSGHQSQGLLNATLNRFYVSNGCDRAMAAAQEWKHSLDLAQPLCEASRVQTV